MLKPMTAVRVGLTCLAMIVPCQSVAAQEPKAPAIKPATIIGSWNSIDRHVAIASLFQPEHGVRKRASIIHFQQTGDRLTGHVIAEDGQKGWKDNRTDFRKVTFVGDRLTFEFDITWRKEHGPLAVEAGRVENKGTVRLEAQLTGDRLAGTWKMFLVDGTEVFRGEWEAVRAKTPAKN